LLVFDISLRDRLFVFIRRITPLKGFLEQFAQPLAGLTLHGVYDPKLVSAALVPSHRSLHAVDTSSPGRVQCRTRFGLNALLMAY
jgi:hypothetical protein